MMTKIIKGLTTFIITTSIMAATTLNFATPQTSSNNSILNIKNKTPNSKYYGSYIITDKTVNKYVQDYLRERNINNSDPSFKDEYNLILSSLKTNQSLQNDLLGDLIYTILDDKLIVQDITGGESFVMDYEIKNNILYGKVYNFSEEMALGHFEDNGNYLIIKAPRDKDTSIYLEHTNS